jgi:hypothetical protein
MEPIDKKYYDKEINPDRNLLQNVERPVTLFFRE